VPGGERPCCNPPLSLLWHSSDDNESLVELAQHDQATVGSDPGTLEIDLEKAYLRKRSSASGPSGFA